MAFSLLRRRVVGTYKSRMMSSAAPSPWLVQPPLFGGGGKEAFNFHNLETKSVMSREISDLLLLEWELAGSSHGWLGLRNPASRDFSLLNPMTGRLIELPPLGSGDFVSRLALSSSPEDQDCRAVIICGDELRLASCLPRRSRAWAPVGSGTDYEDVAYSTAHDRFVCMPAGYLSELEVTFSGDISVIGGLSSGWASKLEVWDVSEPKSPSLDGRVGYSKAFADLCLYPWPCRFQDDVDCWRIKYLVAHGGDLFVVVRHVNPRMREDGSVSARAELGLPYKSVDFDVWRIDLVGGGDHAYMRCSLEGLAMFVGMNESFAVAADENTKLVPDSVYFSDERSLMRSSLSAIEGQFGGHDNGIFSYKNNTFSSCCGDGACPLDPVNYYEIKRIESPPLWFLL